MCCQCSFSSPSPTLTTKNNFKQKQGYDFTYRIVAKELTVAAVTEFPIFLGCGRRGARAPLRAAILILTKPLICLTGLWRVTACTVWELVALAGRIPAKGNGSKEKKAGETRSQ